MFDFGLGSGEILVIAIVALIVIGPKDLPRLLRTIGQYMRKIQAMAREFQNHLNEAAKEAGVEDVKKEVKGMTNFTVTADLDKQGSDIKRAIEQSAPKPAVAPKSAVAPKPAVAPPTNGAGGKEEPAKPAPAAPARPIAATEPVAAVKSKPARQKAEAKPKPGAKSKAKPKVDRAPEAAKS